MIRTVKVAWRTEGRPDGADSGCRLVVGDSV